jgi:hypothetical protein
MEAENVTCRHRSPLLIPFAPAFYYSSTPTPSRSNAQAKRRGFVCHVVNTSSIRRGQSNQANESTEYHNTLTRQASS